ncbi:MAG: aspartate dehydrogenase [Gammaproteobacteria bacterium]|nr:aspartate dehydrogenase [Gammaproteobacteria bacterium]
MSNLTNAHDNVRTPLKVGIAGLGAIGSSIAQALTAGIDGMTLHAVGVRNAAKAADRLRDLNIVTNIRTGPELANSSDVVVECAPAAAFREIVEPAVEAGRTVLAVSVGALLSHPDLVERARETGARIHVPSGAILGLDVLRAAAVGTIESVTMVTRKPPSGLQGVDFLERQGIDVMTLSEPTRVFEGNAADGARHFPANVNVAAAVGLAGIGPQQTTLEVWVDPTIDRNMHTVEVEADAVRFKVSIENVPSLENPRTGRVVAPSVIASLRRLVDPLVVGT